MDKLLRLIVVLALCSPCVRGETPAVLDAADEHALQLALRALKMTERDLGFSKTNVESELILPRARQFLQDPLQLSTYAQLVVSNCAVATRLGALSGFAFQELDTTSIGMLDFEVDPIRVDLKFLTNLPPQAAKAIQLIAFGSSLAAGHLEQASPADGSTALVSFASEALHIDKDAAEIECWQRLGINTATLTNLLARDTRLELHDTELADAILTASDELKMSWLMSASGYLEHYVDKAIGLLCTNQFTGDFEYETDTKLGKIIVTGNGPHVFTNEAFLIIGLGGDNVYSNSAGGANGLASRPISIVIDLGNNSQFVSKRSFSQGSGVFGIGILAALGSNCTFQAKHFSQGAGFFGCGILMTGEGKQTFEADTFCQGAGMFGTGILWQRGGDTTYKANKYAQGFGGIQGCGLLLDTGGNDTYVAGGKEACGWLPGHYFSLSQGFGYGMRPFAGGGVGILCDLKGDDHYKADVYGQGASYWYATGLLLDAEGNDTYEAHQYCQGAGIHLSSGALIDWAGNDTYTAGHICQGAAHDYSVGILIDRAGNDKYTGDTTAQGAAINNSFAMLLDHAGDDTYIGTDPKQSQATGHNGDKREYGSIGLLLDLAGKDSYSQGQSNNIAWLKPLYGAGLDCETPAVVERPFQARPAQASPPPSPPKGRLYAIPPVDPHHPTERLFRLATSDRPDAGQAWDELKTNAVAHLPYLITRSASPNVMVRVKIEELVDHLGTNSIPLLIAGIRETKNDEVARLCCYFLARFNEQARSATPVILPLLKRSITRPVAFYTLGHLRAPEAFAPAMDAVDESRELVRLRATQALGKIGDKRAIPRLIHKLDDEIYDVRYAAEEGLIAFGKTVTGDLRRAYERATSRAKPHLLEALAKLGDERALAFAREFYRDDEPIIRDAVLKSLTDNLTQAQTLHASPAQK